MIPCPTKNTTANALTEGVLYDMNADVALAIVSGISNG